MTLRPITLFGCVWLICAGPVAAQTKLKLSAIKAGSEKVQLVYNGDFQFQGPLVTNHYPFPPGWSRQADMFVGSGTNLTPVNGGVVALAEVANTAPVCLYQREVSLAPATGYVLSAYMWNLGNAANHVNTVVDLNDAPQDPQLTLYSSDSEADHGYFIYRSFNTANTGSNVTLRVFYDGFTGSGTAPGYYPVAAQWDNIAITKASDFLAPQPSGSGANLRPRVSILSPPDGTNVLVGLLPANFSIQAAASDLDGTISKVEFYAGTNKLGQVTNSPYNLTWSNPASGTFQLTAMATDNAGATTVSAPVEVSITVLPQPVPLEIARSGTNLSVSWPASATASALQGASNLAASTTWRVLRNASVAASNRNYVTLTGTNARQFFRLGPELDASTLNRKLLMGYQGWFSCPQDGSQPNQWIHWFRNNAPVATNLTVDFWPDISELDNDELFDTAMTLTNGSPARVYSAFNQKTVLRHFRWMKDNHQDGVFLQRFSSTLSDPGQFSFRNRVTMNVRIGAETYGRLFAIMYDISGQNAATLISTLTNDWGFLVTSLQITNSPQYVRHRGKPVVAVWGFGFTDRPGTPEDALAVINFFKGAGCTVLGGVPTYWRTLRNDSQTDPAWAGAYRAFDIISPWAVGRFGDAAGADNFKTQLIIPDLAEAANYGIDYMPVVFPGFSWTNLNQGPFNQIPRQAGNFYWRQVYNAITAGCTMIYGAMFDEMDEGTAMFKLAPTLNELPVEAKLVPLNVDGVALPSDWYLRLADQASRMLRGEFPPQLLIPITP